MQDLINVLKLLPTSPNSISPCVPIRGHVLRQAELFHVLFKSIFPSKFRSASSPRAVDYHSFSSPNWCSLWSPLEMSKPSQPSFPHLVDYRIDIKFCSENFVRTPEAALHFTQSALMRWATSSSTLPDLWIIEPRYLKDSFGPCLLKHSSTSQVNAQQGEGVISGGSDCFVRVWDSCSSESEQVSFSSLLHSFALYE
ncbi:26S proteasome non-ATPase regulatory subunit 2 homolog A [Tanacetum coccineum]